MNLNVVHLMPFVTSDVKSREESATFDWLKVNNSLSTVGHTSDFTFANGEKVAKNKDKFGFSPAVYQLLFQSSHMPSFATLAKTLVRQFCVQFSRRLIGRWRDLMVTTPDSYSGSPGFKSRSDHLDLFSGSPVFKSKATPCK